MRTLIAAVLLLLAGCAENGGSALPADAGADSVSLRVATYNLEDVRGDDLARADQPRLQRLAAVIQEVRPDVILLNELAYDQRGAPGYVEEEGSGRNAMRFVENYLAVAQREDLQPLRYEAFTAPSNTGIPSGFDLDNSGDTVTMVPPLLSAGEDGSAGAQTAAGRRYGNDAWGFGTFPGQYAMALLVREGLEIVEEEARTFQMLRWSDLPGAEIPVLPSSNEPWYSPEEWQALRLSSKSHWDVPVQLPNGTTLHVLASHPTPPAFDGPERRNHYRNRDEIRFWADYLDDAAYIEDDEGEEGGLPPGKPFVLAGDLNADIDEGDALGNPVRTYLLSHERVAEDVVPEAESTVRAAYPDLDPDDTARWGLRVDYVLPSKELHVRDSGVYRPPPGASVPSDHFLVWIDVLVPPT